MAARETCQMIRDSRLSRASGGLRRAFRAMCFVTLFATLALSSAQGQNPLPAVADTQTPAPAAAAPAAATNTNPLATDQEQVAKRYRKLEDLLLRSAELESANNPSRSALLQQAAQLGKQAQIADLLERAAKSLDRKQFSQAIEDQKISRDNLKRLLDLLQSENRHDRVREQRDEVRRWIEETDRLLRLQISQRGRTEGGQATEQAAQDQGKLADKASDIVKQLPSDEGEPSKPDAKQDSNKNPSESKKGTEPSSPKSKPGQSKQGAPDAPKDSKDSPNGKSSEQPTEKTEAQKGDKKSPNSPSENKPDSKKQPDGKQSDGKNSDGKQSDGRQVPSPNDGKSSPQSPSQQAPSDQAPSDQPSDQQSQQDAQSPSPQQQKQPQDPAERARKRLQNAQQKMKQAQKELEDSQRKGAVENQLQAENELRAAIEELEEILRQLREEEIERSLAALEIRLRRMLEMQGKVLDETKRLQELSGDQANRQIEMRATSLSVDERKILAEGERAQLLLREEGSSVAFPEAIAQVVTDIESVVGRLTKADVGKLTVSLEQEIVSALEEMVNALAAVQKEQKERKERERQQGQPQQGEPGDQPLVDKLAELRLIRTLQVRVNNRTNTLSEMLRDPNDAVGQADAEDILHQIRQLGDREAKVQRVTRDIVVGKAQ